MTCRSVLAAVLVTAFVADLPGAAAAGRASDVSPTRLTIGAGSFSHPPRRIVIPTPPRPSPMLTLPRSSVRAVVVPAVRRFSARGPLIRLDPKAAQAGFLLRTVQPPPVRSASPLTAPSAHGTPLRRSTLATPPTPIPTAPPTAAPATIGTGINHWWEYVEEDVAGAGHLMINVPSGNLLVQTDDLSVPHKGIALAFRRTYNSQSNRDVNGDDGALPGQYGNGWTNTFDAHILSIANGIRVFDIDGAEYDYTLNGATYVPPAGQHSTLKSNGSCGFYWTKPTGTIYYFYGFKNATCGNPVLAYIGRLYQIIGRNNHNTITFSASWDNNYTGAGAKMAQLVATTESGMAATLTFADFSGHRLLQTLARPDGVTLTYNYDSAGNLTDVVLPDNGSGVTRHETYGYTAGANAVNHTNSVLLWAASPRWAASSGADGGYVQFAYGGAAVNQIAHKAFVDPTVTDASGTGPIQPQPADQSGVAQAPFLTESFTIGGSGSTGSTSYVDSDGHQTNWIWDSLGRTYQLQRWTGAQWLVNNTAWDSANNIVTEVDQNGNQSDYAYDLNGNTIAAAAPLTTTSVGTFRPTQYFSYDVDGSSRNNITSYCDPRWSHANGRDWNVVGPPVVSDALCSTTTGSPTAPTVPTMTYLHPTYEPFGEQSALTTAMGYKIAYSYPVSPQVDYGQSIGLLGDSYLQPVDGTTNQMHQTLQYDANGNLTSYNSGSGTSTLSYDALGRVLSITDPDGVTSYTSYNADSSKAKSESAYQHANNLGALFAYDTDGDLTSETHHFGNAVGVTIKKYDGDDRLVEVQQPSDQHDLYPYPWLTRYVYDLTKGGLVSSGTALNFHAHGSLYKTEEYIPNGTVRWIEPGLIPQTLPPPQWTDVAATATDALDRPIALYRKAGLQHIGKSYDAAGALGLLAQKCNANNECLSYSYDALDHTVAIAANLSNTPTRSYGYDEDGRQASATSAAGGMTTAYDADGRETTRVQAVVAGPTATFTYHYFPDGKRSALDLSGPATWPGMFSYAYRPDGKMQALKLSAGSSATWNTTFTAAGRPQTKADSTIAGISQMTYDAYGRLAAKSGPVLSESGLQYDAEGETTQDVQTVTGHAATSYTAAYTSRSELVQALSPVAMSDKYANGMRIPYTHSPPCGGHQFQTGHLSFDPSLSVSSEADGGTVCIPKGGGAQDSAQDYQYDATGRLASLATSINDSQTNSYIADGAQFTKIYDADDHVVQQGNEAPGFVLDTWDYQQAAYTWGPTGHPFRVGISSKVNLAFEGNPYPTDFQYDNLYWDDDTLLFTTNSAGTIDDVKIGATVDYTPGNGGIVTWDRDAVDRVVACHNQSGIGNVSQVTSRYGGSLYSVSAPPAVCTTPSMGISAGSNVGRGGILWSARSDGFSDGYNAFQGARTYDINVDSWNSPDAYRGDVRDPMSQKPYMWNRNNPYEYTDPSGFAPQVPQWDRDWDNQWREQHGFSTANANGLLGTLLHDAGAAILDAYNSLTNNGRSKTTPTGSDLEDSIADSMVYQDGYIGTRYAVNNGAVDVYKDPHSGDSAVIGIANNGRLVDLHIYGPNGIFSGYGYEFGWATYLGYGTLFFHQFRGIPGFHVFAGFEAPQAGPGAS